MQTFNAILEVVESCKKDVDDIDAGVKAPARRLRKKCQELRVLITQLRKDCLNHYKGITVLNPEP